MSVHTRAAGRKAGAEVAAGIGRRAGGTRHAVGGTGGRHAAGRPRKEVVGAEADAVEAGWRE
eukprot:scaffold32246_cov61-Phaeocystis_antarctica.AAC.2